MTRQRVLLISLLSVICGLVLPYVALGDYVYWTDEAYQALSVRNYSDAPIGMLAFYIGNLWTRLAGDGLYQLRLLMVICYQISIAASCLFLYRKTGQPLLSSLLFLMLCVAARFVLWMGCGCLSVHDGICYRLAVVYGASGFKADCGRRCALGADGVEPGVYACCTAGDSGADHMGQPR